MQLLLLLLSASLAALTSASSSASTLHIALLPTAAPPAPFLDILHTPDTDTASILTTHPLPPSLLSSSDPKSSIRLGLARPDHPSTPAVWSTISIPSSSLSANLDRTLHLHLDASGAAYTLSWTSAAVNSTLAADPKESKSKAKPKAVPDQALEGTISVAVRRPLTGQKPVLNRPVVLNQHGQIEGQEQGDNRTFLQKYWWAIAAFLVLQVVAGGGGGKE